MNDLITPAQTPSPASPPAYRHHAAPAHAPNPHPYAIKTTSTGVLSRSGSQSSSVAHARHSYVPLPSPGASPARARPAHRHAKSLSAAPDDGAHWPALPSPAGDAPSPRPLPTPPLLHDHQHQQHQQQQFPSAGPFDDWAPPPPAPRAKRADTLPSFPAPPEEPAAAGSSGPLDGLPPNPKAWSPAQLGAHLASALRSRAGTAGSVVLPLPVAHDISAFVREAKITGRTFLRMTEADFDQLGVNPLWRNALLAAARNLRQSTLKSRILEPMTSDEEGTGGVDGLPTSSRLLPRTASPGDRSPYGTRRWSSSASSLDRLSLSGAFADPASDPTFPDSPAAAAAHSDDDADEFGALSKFRRERTPSSVARLETGRLRRSRIGAVRGIVRGYEERSSGSESGGSPTSSCDDGPPPFTAPAAAPAEEEEGPREMSVAELLAHEDAQTGASAWESAESVPGGTMKPAPAPSAPAGPCVPQAADEPAMDALLAASDGAVGARAWEALDALPAGVTVKHAPATVSAGARAELERAPEMDKGVAFRSVHGRRQERRFISAIFNPDKDAQGAGPVDGADLADGADAGASVLESTDGAALPPVLDATSVKDDPGAYIDTLETSLSDAYALLGALQARLAAVEGIVAALEAPSASDAASAAESVAQQVAALAEQTLALDAERAALFVREAELAQREAALAAQREQELVRRRAAEPPLAEQAKGSGLSVGGLPSYLLLVGLGACVVAFQVVLKRAGGVGGRAPRLR